MFGKMIFLCVIMTLVISLTASIVGFWKKIKSVLCNFIDDVIKNVGVILIIVGSIILILFLFFGSYNHILKFPYEFVQKYGPDIIAQDDSSSMDRGDHDSVVCKSIDTPNFINDKYKDSASYSYNVVNTISGILTPFFSLLAVIVAFITLFKQTQQNNLTAFENHLFQMIDQQHKLEERIIAKHGSFRDLYNQFCYIYEITKEIMTEIKVEDNIKEKIINEKNESGKEIKNEEVEKEGKEEFKNKTLEIAYYIFYFGVDRDFVCDKTGKNIEEYFSKDFAKKLFEKLNLPHGWFHNQKSEELGIYYRNLFNAIWYIDHKCPVDDREKKEEYAKLMRTNISDFAQLMLYYNMQGKRGKAWLDDSPKEIKYPKRKKSIEEGKIDVHDCLLTRYFPIKNCAIGLENLDIDPRSDGRKNLFSNEVIDYELKL